MFADKEPHIVINGVVLDHAQTIAVRNAISTYQARLGEVEDIMLYSPR